MNLPEETKSVIKVAEVKMDEKGHKCTVYKIRANMDNPAYSTYLTGPDYSGMERNDTLAEAMYCISLRLGYGAAAALGRKGGSKTSEAKKKAGAKNMEKARAALEEKKKK